MASKKTRDLQQRVWQQKTEATAAYDDKDSATRDEIKMQWEVEMSEELKMAYLKAVIKCPLAENLRQNQDLALREMIKIFEIYANNEAKANALAASEEYTDEQMQEDMIKRIEDRHSIIPLVPEARSSLGQKILHSGVSRVGAGGGSQQV